jgi:hypothetical protein
METYEEQILAGFEEQSMCSAQEYPVSQRVLPGSAEARAMSVGSGRQCSMWLSESDPLGAFSRILLESLHWTNSEEYCYVWERLDTRFALSAFQLTPLGQSTEDNGCSLWRSPTGMEDNGGGANGQDRLDQGHALRLRDQVKTPALWPTPTVPNGGHRNPDGTSITGRKPDGGKAQIDLREYAIRMYLTPTNSMTTVQDMEQARFHSTKRPKYSALWPTPTERDWKSTSHGKAGNARPLSEVAGLHGSGSLNPRFVEELMGFPIDHTALKL